MLLMQFSYSHQGCFNLDLCDSWEELDLGSLHEILHPVWSMYVADWCYFSVSGVSPGLSCRKLEVCVCLWSAPIACWWHISVSCEGQTRTNQVYKILSGLVRHNVRTALMHARCQTAGTLKSISLSALLLGNWSSLSSLSDSFRAPNLCSIIKILESSHLYVQIVQVFIVCCKADCSSPLQRRKNIVLWLRNVMSLIL